MAYTALCAFLARWALRAAALGLVLLVLCVQWQVIGRYLLNDTPVWTEPVALLLLLYITALAVAVGVRDAGHLGLESLVVLLPPAAQRVAEALIQLLVALFALLMAGSAWEWMQLKWEEPKPILGIPEAFDYLPLLIGGVLMGLFCIEQLIALWRKRPVPATRL
ncbi:TRAP transporter small permease [Pseudorhodoferax sp.]|jgi:TRAP-type C4-dicarboxylate transport system permease small subunit|uniref:TRAP transporter small permease n=1 Tax=Pseudorhodoferax sp. TaxID=1993553 RepID=UPI001B4291FB|nr:TRAP transporter small permease [Pseudorhodoferax sp.]MBP8144598.1 TRAP transporter small permease [Inhella sp.]